MWESLCAQGLTNVGIIMLLCAIQIPQMPRPFRPYMARSHISIMFNCTLHVCAEIFSLMCPADLMCQLMLVLPQSTHNYVTRTQLCCYSNQT